AAPPPARRSRLAAVRERLREVAATERGRFLLAASPTVLAAVASLWLLAVGAASFAGILEVCGVLTIILSSGIFPTLLLASIRRKGLSIPDHFLRFLGHPVLLATLYALFMT